MYTYIYYTYVMYRCLHCVHACIGYMCMYMCMCVMGIVLRFLKLHMAYIQTCKNKNKTLDNNFCIHIYAQGHCVCLHMCMCVGDCARFLKLHMASTIMKKMERKK